MLLLIGAKIVIIIRIYGIYKLAFCGLVMFFLEKNASSYCGLKIKLYLCNAFEKERFSQRSFGEMAEWSNAAVLKTVVLKGTGGSNPSLSAERCKSWIYTFFIYYHTKKQLFVKPLLLYFKKELGIVFAKR